MHESLTKSIPFPSCFLFFHVMDWRKLCLVEHLLSVVGAKRRLFSWVSLILALSLLAFYLVIPITYTTQPPASSLFSWVSSLPNILNSSSTRPTTQNSTTNTPGRSVFHLNLTCLGLRDFSFGGRFGSSSAGEKNEWVVPKSCDIFDGRWVRDERKPYYAPGSCPYVGPDFNCIRNGRPDDGFMKWRWQPNGCDIPRLNATDFLEQLRGKRLIFVGDSLNRNMWESLVCILRQSVADKKRVFEISGRTNFQGKGYYVFKFKDYNCSIELVVSPFLVREENVKGPSGNVEQILRLDLLDHETSKYRNADILVFNTGHWWNHHKTSKGENYYQEGNYLYPVLDVNKAYTKALTTWAKWVDKNINRNTTHVIFRGYSPMHFRDGEWDSGGKCHKETEPTFNQTVQREYNPKMRILHQVLKQMKTPVTYLNISRLTDYRKDGHPSIYGKKCKTVREKWAAERSYQDCSHWCLPGIPDTWNELLYASLLMDGKGSWIN